MNTMYTVGDEQAGKRLDSAVADLAQLSRNYAKQLIEQGNVKINSTTSTKPKQLLGTGDTLGIEVPDRADVSLDLPIVYEDDDIMVINKPAGLLTHGTSQHQAEASVVDFIRPKTSDSDPLRPGIVHRLDRNTSGLMVLAKTSEAKVYMQEQFAKHLVQKTYVALVEGNPESSEGVIKLPIGHLKPGSTKRQIEPSGKPAETHYQVIEAFQGYSLLEASPKTGRTHQIRVHLAALGHPIVGDTLYGSNNRPGLSRPFLHAKRLQFTAPNGKPVDLTIELPAELNTLAQRLRNGV